MQIIFYKKSIFYTINYNKKSGDTCKNQIFFVTLQAVLKKSTKHGRCLMRKKEETTINHKLIQQWKKR